MIATLKPFPAGNKGRFAALSSMSDKTRPLSRAEIAREQSVTFLKFLAAQALLLMRNAAVAGESPPAFYRVPYADDLFGLPCIERSIRFARRAIRLIPSLRHLEWIELDGIGGEILIGPQVEIAAYRAACEDKRVPKGCGSPTCGVCATAQ